MSRMSTLAVVCALLHGCASSAGSSAANVIPSEGGGELIIRDYMETYLPRPVYMARFEIVPEQGVALLYPTPEDEQVALGPGIHRMRYSPPGFVHAQRERFRFGNRRGGSSVTLLVVTSDQPLNLDPFHRAPSGLRDHLGPRAFINEIYAVEEILRTVIPDPAIATTEHRINTVSIPVAWRFR